MARRGGDIDAFIRKYDTAGNALWTRQFRSTTTDRASAVVANSTGVYVLGIADVTKFNVNGTLEWTRRIVLNVRDAPVEESTGIVADATGVYVTGRTFNSRFLFLRKYDAAGNEIWTQVYAIEVVSPTSLTADGTGLYMCGRGTVPARASPGAVDGVLQKFDLSGKPLWSRQFGTAAVDDLPTAVLAASGGIYVAGRAVPPGPGIGNSFLRRFDTEGNEQWVRQINSATTDAVAADLTGVYITGSTSGALPGQRSAGGNDLYVRKYDFQGTEVWTRQAGSSGGEFSVSMTADSSGIFVGGSTTGTFDGQARSGGALDAFVAKFSHAPSTGTPVITSVENGASFAPVIQDNSWITIRGTNLAPTTRIWDAQREIIDGRLPATLDGTGITINGRSAAVYYISPTQINALAPAGNATGPAQVVVTTSNGASPPFTAQVQQFSPGFFAFQAQGGRYPAATLANGRLLGPFNLFGGNPTTVPASPGDIVVLYGTGFGPTNPSLDAGRIFSGAIPLSFRVEITIGGISARVLFAGMSSPGLCQFNVEVPDLATGDQALTASIDSVSTTQQLHIAVRR